MENRHPPEPVAVAGNVENRRPLRGEAETTGHEDQVAAGEIPKWPGLAVGPAEEDSVADDEPRQGVGDISHRADGVSEELWRRRIGADRDRRLADAGEVEHVELPRREGVLRADGRVDDAQVVAADAGRLVADGDDAPCVGLPRVGRERGRARAAGGEGGGIHGVGPGDGAGVSRIAATSAVRSIPTGHQVMQRPQPVHPEVPNWSIQPPSLCVSHCR